VIENLLIFYKDKGGTLLTYDADWPLRFVVDEKIHFPKEYPLKELVTLSLEPLVDVDEKESYVCIRGELELRGEYKTGDPIGRDSFDQYFPVNMVHVYRGEDDVAEFAYSFPIDVTIPIARVNNQEDIQVCVDLFDYELTKEGTLLLHTDLTILGVRGETIRTEENVELEEDELTPFPPFYEMPIEEDILPPVPSRSEHKQVVEVQPIKSEELEHESLEIVESIDNEIELTAANKGAEEESPSSNNEILEMVHEPEEKKKGKKDASKKKGSLSLTEFFNRYEEVPAVKWKMCIVQKQDSLEELSIKYNVPVQHLARVNHLDPTKDLKTGQSLYIPQ
jgi:stage VI sporulation protein D